MSGKPVLFECDASEIDVRVAAGIAVFVIETEEGRVIVSAPQDILERLQLRIRLELDSSEGRATRPADSAT